MKTKMSKVLAIAASAVLLVCMLAVGFTASADVTYAHTVNVYDAFTPDTGYHWGAHGEHPDYPYLLDEANAPQQDIGATFNVGEIITDYKLVAFQGFSDYKLLLSTDGSNWVEQVRGTDYTENKTGDHPNGAWASAYYDYIGTTDAANGYKYVRIEVTAKNPWGLPTPGFKTFSYNVGSAPITYAENVKVKTAFTAEWGSHGEVDSSYGLLPEGGSATFEAKGAITDYKFSLANGGGDSAYKVEFSKDGATWDAATGTETVTGTHNGAWGSSWVTYSGTNDAASAYKYVRVTSTKLNIWVPAIPFYDTFEYNYEEIAAPQPPMADSYANTITYGSEDAYLFRPAAGVELKNSLRGTEIDAGFFRPMNGTDKAKGDLIFA